MYNKVITAAKILMTFAILGYVLSLISFGEMEKILSRINSWYLVFLVLLFFLFIFLGALNIYFIVLSMKKISFAYILKTFSMGVSMGMFTPAYVGEFGSVTFLLREKGLSLSEGLSVPTIDKFISVIVASILCLLGLWIHFPQTSVYIHLGLLSGLLSIAAVLFFRPMRRYLRRTVIEPFLPWTIRFLNAFLSFFLNHWRLVFLNFMGTTLRAFVGAFMIWLGLYALGVSRGVWDVAFISFVARMVSYIPITINGMGLLEGAAINAFSIMDIQPEPILLALLIDRSIAMIFALTVIALFSWKQGLWILKRRPE